MCTKKSNNSNEIIVYTEDNGNSLKPGRTIKIKPNIRVSVVPIVRKVD